MTQVFAEVFRRKEIFRDFIKFEEIWLIRALEREINIGLVPS
jgi:hypothetical protein